jgi:prolyl oligopeptidase
MKKWMIVLLLLAGCTAGQGLQYPDARKSDVVDDYHGTAVQDPYRWLEDPDAEETRAWIEAENEITDAWLKEIPQRPKIRYRLEKLWNYERYGIPFKQADRYFFSRNDGLQNQSVIYWTDSLEAEPKVLIDPNTLSEDGTVALNGYMMSRDGKWMAYGLSRGGSDWTEWHVREVETGKDLDDHLKWIKFSSVSWDKELKGFYYGRYDAPQEGAELQQKTEFPKICYHALGTPQAEDRLIFEAPEHKDWSFGSRVTDDGNYLIITVRRGTARKNKVFYKDLSGEDAAVVELIGDFEAMFSYIDNKDGLFWFFTNLDAPRGRVIAVDLASPGEENRRTVIPEADEVLRRANVINDTFIGTYLKDARSEVRFFDLDGKPKGRLPLPGLGSVRGFGGKRTDTETFYRFLSFNDPGTIYRYDMATGKSGIFRRPELKFDPSDYVTRQVFFSSGDGVRVPMFISHRKDLAPDSSTPALLHGYGGFNTAMTPFFSVQRLAWMEMGGLFAVANIRGGGEYGNGWHEAGMKLKKQNSFDDFIAAGEWLIDNGYTSKRKLAISGASNGGLLVGACMTQRPDLFGACLPAVGVMDMLRFHKFTIGWAWVSDYGSPDDPEEFEAIRAYSPYHNIKDGTAYPATLVTTADHDDRVVPAHSFKFAARLQEAQGGDAPVLIRIETKAGHGAGKPTTKRIEEAADTIAFLVRALDIEVP